MFCPFFFFCRFLRNPTELKSIKNISQLRQQPLPQAVNGSAKRENGNGSIVSALNTQQLPQISALVQQQQQQQQFQHPPNSPRVHALNGAFHYLSTSSQNSPPHPSSPNHSIQSQSSSSSSVSAFKQEPSIDIDDMPTDLSTGGERKSNSDCYPYVSS